MKTVVVDCSVVVPWFFPEENSAAAQFVLDSYKNGRITCCAPALLHAEFGNTVWKKMTRKLCSKDLAETQIGLFLKSGIKIYRCDEILTDAFSMSGVFQCTVYDALYCALAKAIKAELATLDARMMKMAGSIGIKCVTSP